MRLYPDSVAGRTIIVLLAGLMLSHLVSTAIYYGDRSDALISLGGSQIAERIASIGRLVDGSPPRERARIVAAVNGPTLRVTWSRESMVPEEDAGGWRTRIMTRVLAFHLGETARDRIRVRYAEAPTLNRPPHPRAVMPMPGMSPQMMPGMSPQMMGAHMRHMMGEAILGESVRVSYRLGDGSWLNFAAPTTADAPFWSTRLALSLAVMLIAVILLSIWIVTRLTAPLATFSRAAERLGIDVNAPPLPETGPREVRRAARAFNEMQRRIGSFINDRTRMLAAISHDLRTPITRLRLRSEFIDDDEQRRKVLDDLTEMEAMIRSVLSFARGDAEAEPRVTLDLVALVHSVCDDFRDSGADIEFAGDGRISLAGRPVALRRALANVIENALAYGERADVRLIDEADRVVMRIEDVGPGIPADEMERVFEPFHRVDPSRSRETGGVGLGLGVARTILRAHGGDVQIANRAEGGLRVDLILPREAVSETETAERYLTE